MSYCPTQHGWKELRTTGFSQVIGPIWARRESNTWIYGFQSEPKHINHIGLVHGGVLMSLIDIAFSLVAWQTAERQPCITVQLNTQFVAAAKLGDFIEAHGKVVRRTNSLVFMSGTLRAADCDIVAASGIWKMTRKV